MAVLATLSAALQGRYEIERELGQGGMAEVYVARDLRVGRRVAIKVLRPEVAQAVGADRFLREVEIAAGLQHPHILPLFDSDQADGLLYYVMPLVEGETLRERLRREVQLPIDDVLCIARQVADALDHAHSHGVVHRDIKPENLLLSGDRTFVADFGIARLAEAAGGEWRSATGTTMWRTDTGIVVGTLGYMSPEQATATPQLDGRSDQYALACVVYEMLAGETPFQALSLQVMVSKLLTLPPPSVRIVRDKVPGPMDAALQRALSRTPADRFRTCGDFVEAMGREPGWREWFEDVLGSPGGKIALATGGAAVALLVFLAGPWDPGGPTPAADTTRYVVFPFQTEGGGTAALTEVRLHDALGRWDGIAVVPALQVREAQGRDSVPSSEGRAAEVARGLGAGRYVRVSIALLGDSLRVHAAMYDATARGPPLSERSVRLPPDRTGADAAFAFIADGLLFPGGSPPEGTPGPEATRSLPAAHALASGERALQGWDLIGADSAFSRAARADTRYAQAHLRLALVRAWAGAESARWLVATEQAAMGRVRLSSREQGLLDAISAQGRGDLAQACPLWRNLARTEPNAFDAWYGYAHCLRADTMVVADRSSPSGWRFRSSYHEAVRAFRRAFELQPAILSSFRSNAYGRLRALLMTSTRTVLPGHAAGADSLQFRGRPVWTGDSLLLLPYPLAIARNPVGPWDPQSVHAAVARQRELFRDIAVTWVTEFPQNAAAMEALAVSLETLANPAAIDTFRHARALAVTPAERSSAAAGEVWMQVKLGAPWTPSRLHQAKRLADSILSNSRPESSELRSLVSLAALTGRAHRAASLLRRSVAETGWPVAPSLEAAPVLLIYASLGGPVDSLRSLERRTMEQISRAPLPQRKDLALEWLGRPARLAAPVVMLSAVSQLRGQGDSLVDALAAWALTDSSAARGMLDYQRRFLQYPDRSLDALYPEAVLYTWLGDARGAIAWLDPTLSALAQAAPGTFGDPARPGALVNAMALRAQLAAREGDRDGARAWGGAVAILWADADEFLQPLVSRMRRLAK